jgi:hypothetical protein
VIFMGFLGLIALNHATEVQAQLPAD